MPADHQHDPATVELLAEAVHLAYLATCARLGWPVKPENQVPYHQLSEASKDLDRASVAAVLDALTAAGKLRRSLYAAEGEPRCGEPYPDGGDPCQLRPGHDTHARPASGGFDTWKRVHEH